MTRTEAEQTAYDEGLEDGERQGYDSGVEAGYDHGYNSCREDTPDLTNLLPPLNALLKDLAPQDSTEICPCCDTQGSHTRGCVIDQVQDALDEIEVS